MTGHIQQLCEESRILLIHKINNSLTSIDMRPYISKQEIN